LRSQEPSYHNGVVPHPQETTWERTAPSQIVLNSIFAALDGALIVILLQDSQATRVQFLSLSLLVASFCLFAVSAEKGVVALDERDVRKYAYYMLPYNLGVICGGVAIESLMYARFSAKIEGRLTPYFGICSRWLSLLLWFIVAMVFMSTWIRDTYWLLFCKREDFDRWLEELQDKRHPEPEPGYLMKLFYSVRKRFHG
jgi:hypothetical protein